MLEWCGDRETYETPAASENSSGTFLFPFFIIAFSDIDAFGRREDVINSVVGGYWEYFTSVADMF